MQSPLICSHYDTSDKLSFNFRTFRGNYLVSMGVAQNKPSEHTENAQGESLCVVEIHPVTAITVMD